MVAGHYVLGNFFGPDNILQFYSKQYYKLAIVDFLCSNVSSREIIKTLNLKYRSPSRDMLSNTLVAWYRVETGKVKKELEK